MRRLTLYALAAPLSLATGLAAWLAADGLSVRADTFEALETRVAALRAPNPVRGRPSDPGAASLLGAPLFALTTGPGAIREPAVRIDGISISRRRTAALVSIDGGPAAWLSVGETRDGVSLQSLNSGAAIFETALGVKTLSLGQQSAASAPAPGAPGPQAAAAPDALPPGVRAPPEPASAPGP